MILKIKYEYFYFSIKGIWIEKLFAIYLYTRRFHRRPLLSFFFGS